MSKHIYIGSQRMVSKLIDAGTMGDPQNEEKATCAGSTFSFPRLQQQYFHLLLKLWGCYNV
ncbi:MAG: hypothetical protein Q7U47_01180 [Paludibacter sp.]|nr:hypothetical protein [Paludibacter sp.]